MGNACRGKQRERRAEKSRGDGRLNRPLVKARKHVRGGFHGRAGRSSAETGEPQKQVGHIAYAKRRQRAQRGGQHWQGNQKSTPFSHRQSASRPREFGNPVAIPENGQSVRFPEKMNHYPSLAHDECAAGVLGGRDGEADAPAAGDGGVCCVHVVLPAEHRVAEPQGAVAQTFRTFGGVKWRRGNPIRPSLAHDERAAGVLGGRDGEENAPAAGDSGV